MMTMKTQERPERMNSADDTPVPVPHRAANQHKTSACTSIRPPKSTIVQDWHIEGRHPSMAIGVNPVYAEWLKRSKARPGDVIDIIGYQLYRRRKGLQMESTFRHIISHTANSTGKEVSCHE